MKITVFGRGNVGGGLADLWERAGHDVERLGRDGGDASGADVVLIAVPAGALPEALGKVTGLEGKTILDATNIVRGERPDGAESLAAYVKHRTGGNVAKAFNANFANLYDRLGEAKSTPSCIYCSDEAARTTTEQLIRDAGYEPVSAGGLENARALEDFLQLIFAISQSGTGPFLYRIASADRL
jgi:8-hydroxy-5-deazaflavin:NADPH oxidoreductase